MVAGSALDPEKDRIEALVRRVRAGAATEAEREELALYGEDRSDVTPALERAEADRRLGGAWLARVEADRRMEAAERSAFVVAERTVGVALAVTGAVAATFAPIFGILAVAGLGILGLSVLRTRAAAKDPYKDIEK